MKRKDHMPAAGCCSRISLGMVMFIISFMFGTVALYAVDIAEAVTYNMQSGTGDLNGITANYGTCATNATAPVIVPMNTSGSNACTAGRSASTGNVGDQILLIISDTPYSQAMNITGIDVTGNLRDYQDTANPGSLVGIQYQLGYVLSGAFTSFGSADEARDYSTATAWTTDLSGISGTAPSGSSLAIQVLKQNPSGTQYRYYFTSTSVVLNVTETAASSTPPSEVGGTLATSPQYNNGGTYYIPNPVTITENFTSTPAVNACQYTLNNGGAWTAGAVSGTGPYTCTASNINPGSGTLTIGMRASNNGGSTWSTLSAILMRTVDATGPTDGGLTATTISYQQIDLSWTAASDSGSGLAAANTYKLVRATGATPPADCSGSAFYTGTGTSHSDTTVSESTQYSYRVCAYDNLGNVSSGATNSATTPSAPCVRTDPTVSITPASQNVGQGGLVNYTLTVTNNDTAACGPSTFNLSWTNTPGMPNANFTTTGEAGSIGPISPGGSSPTIGFTHNAAAGAPLSTTQQTYVSTSDANHANVSSNTVTSTVGAAAPVPAGNWYLFLMVIAGIMTYSLIKNKKWAKTT